jgi:Protein kinase domain
MRKVVGALIALAAMIAAAASQPGIEAGRTEAAELGAQRVAAANSERVAAALEGYLRWVQERAVSAAALPQIRAQLTLLRNNRIEGELSNTLRDFFRAEHDWDAWRREFPVTGVSNEGPELALAFGAEPNTFAAATLIERARAGTPASGYLAAAGIAYAAAAARVAVPGLAQPPVLLIARPLDDDAVGELAKRAGLALVLSDGARVRGRGGKADDVEKIGDAIGKEAGPGFVTGDEGAWAASARVLVPGFWLWALSDTRDAAREAGGAAFTTRVIVWGAGALIGLLALFFGFRRSTPPTVATDLPAPARKRTPRSAETLSPILQESTPTPLLPLPGPNLAPTATSLDARTTMVATPLRAFGRYVLLNQLGEGGMARVYTAVVFGAEGFRRKFVVKRLRPELVEDPAVVAQFIDEAKMASSLVHSNIVPVLDFGKVDEEYFLATEYILGRDLGRVTQRSLDLDRRALSVDVVLFIAQEILKALEYAHSRKSETGQPLGLVHRDVSPGNVLVSARGEVKLFDFGIVKAEGRVTRTQHGVVKGNVTFMSPEQARGIEVDARADLFSLGLVLFACASGQTLYGGNTTYELLLKAASGPGPEELARLRALPSPLAAILEKALAVDPAARFQDAAEFAAAVAPHVGRGESELAELVNRLFGDDFRNEESGFATAAPPPTGPPNLRLTSPEGRS